MSSKILVLDLETTGLLDNASSVMTEIAMAVWDYKEKRVVRSTSTLVNALGREEVPPEIVQLTGITTEAVRKYGAPRRQALEAFSLYAKECEGYILARNGIGFDWPFLVREANREGMTLGAVTVIDDYLDIEYPDWVRGRSLSHIAADYGFLNPFPHNAMGDVLTLIKVLEKGEFDMDAAKRSAETPLVEVRACVSFSNNHLAKERKFQWDPDGKKWYKRMRAATYEKVAPGFPFKSEFRRCPTP